jgi:hypothetical protein
MCRRDGRCDGKVDRRQVVGWGCLRKRRFAFHQILFLPGQGSSDANECGWTKEDDEEESKRARGTS